MQYTDNAELVPDDIASDTIISGVVAVSLEENDGPLVYRAAATLRKENYVNDTFEDAHYFNLGARANWELIRQRLDLYLTNNFSQRAINTLDSDTPDNRQDSNAFVFGSNINFPITASQQISLIPEYSQFYYEIATTNNRQYSLAANWNYQMYRLTNVGLNVNVRTIKYDDIAIADTTFTNVAFVTTGQRASSNYSVDLGATNVKRDRVEGVGGSNDSSEETGFAGNASWTVDLSTRSSLETLILTQITDTSKVSRINSPGNPDDVQLVTDVIRNSMIGLTYSREDAALHTSIRGGYRKIKYSENESLNSLIQSFGADLKFPVTPQVSSGVFLSFDNIKRSEISREDKRFNVGANVAVTLTHKLSGSFIVQYHTKESTDSLQNYDEFSVFASLNYGFGGVRQRSVAY